MKWLRKKSSLDQKLKQSEERYRTLFDSIMDAVFIVDLNGRFLDVNPYACEHLGYSKEELLAMSLGDVDAPEYTAMIRDRIQELTKRGSFQFETKHVTKDGRVVSVEVRGGVFDYWGVPAIVSIARNIEDRYRNLNSLKTAHEEVTYLLNAITSILIGVSRQDVITHWNYMAEETFGIPASEAVGMKILSFSIKWDWDEICLGIATCTSEKRPVSLSDIKYIDADGKNGILGISITPIKNDKNELSGFLIYGRDVTDKRVMEQQLLQTSKLATVGEIATGVAHELNQPLNVIKIASQYMLDAIQQKYYTEDFMRERLEKIVAQVDRAAVIIAHLKDFGRKSDYNFRKIDPNKPILSAFDLVGEQLRVRSIRVILDLDPHLPQIQADGQKLEQVFINLIVNAKDSFEEMKNSLHDNTIRVRSFPMPGSGMIGIEFSDSGPGIPRGIINRVFEPFFTTKEVGKGTGLGLSISYGIIKSHRGSIDVASEGEGTTFKIALPAVRE
jgi:PAS domain S-box-containing protein